MRNIRESLYRFHKELNRPFPTTAALVARALELISEHVTVNRLSSFLLEPREKVLSLHQCLSDGMLLEVDEEIDLLETSPLNQLVEGKRGSVAYARPHPILYVPLKSPVFLFKEAPAISRGFSGEKLEYKENSAGMQVRGILRLERFSRRPFTVGERNRAGLFASELAQNLYRSEIGYRNRQRLKRMEALTELTAIFASSLRVQDGLKLILQGIQRHFALDRARLYLVDRAAAKLRGEVSVDMRGRVQSLKSEEIEMKPGAHRFVDVLLGSGGDPLLERYEKTVLHVPLTLQGSGIGLLVVDNMISQDFIEPEDAELLHSFAGQIALAIDNARLFDEVQALSLYDSLTALPVRRYFEQRFQEELYRAQRFGQSLALAMIDIDYFKGINDTYGHQIGDQALREVGRVVLASLRKIDFPCRYGGDEILLLLPQVGEEETLRIMTRIVQQLKEIRVPVPFSRAQEVRITVSAGVAVYPGDGRTLEELIHKADEALYWVKSHGRDGVASRAQTLQKADPSSVTPQ